MRFDLYNLSWVTIIPVLDSYFQDTSIQHEGESFIF